MASRRLLPLIVVGLCQIASAQSPGYGVGRPPTDGEIRAWDISISPTGRELPPGRGTPREGASLYVQKGCAGCHGRAGSGGQAPTLIRSDGTTKSSLPCLVPCVNDNNVMALHSPFATVMWDYINRAMPIGKEGTLKPDEVYALTAFLLYRNDVIAEDAVMDARTLPQVAMPNRDGFALPEPWSPGRPRLAGYPTESSPQVQPGSAPAIASKLDTPQARVIVATLQPRTPADAKNGHATNRVVIYLDDGVMTRKQGEQSSRIDFRRGDVRWVPASGAYIAENVSDHPIRILEIDLKTPPTGVAAATPLDPATVDPQHYKVAFENDYVRVLRIHYDAHDKGQLHEHILNRVVVYLNDQPGAKADDVRMSGASKHVEENASGQPADRIAVELK